MAVHVDGPKEKGVREVCPLLRGLAYARQSPEQNLQGVFAQFASWLKKLYMCLSGIPGAQFDESVQDMFSNMFLAEAQIREDAIRQNVEALFATAEEAGMTPEEFESYHQSVSDMIAAAEAEQTELNTPLSERVNAMRPRALRELQGEVKGELKRLSRKCLKQPTPIRRGIRFTTERTLTVRRFSSSFQSESILLLVLVSGRLKSFTRRACGEAAEKERASD